MIKKPYLALLTVGLIALPALAFAQSSTSMTEINATAIPNLIKTISSWLRIIAYTASVGTFIYAGILYFNSAANPAGTSAAKNAIRAVFIGLAIVILSEVIVRVTLGFVTQPVNQTGINTILH